MDCMLAMARLDNPEGSPFLVGEKQRAWLEKDLERVNKKVPIVVCSHAPLQRIYKGWNFWTDDAQEVLALLQPFRKVTVLYGHVHQIQYNQIGNISFHAVMATAWQIIDVHTGNVDMHYQLPNNEDRTVAFNPKTGRPEDEKFQNPKNRRSPQAHY